MSEEPLRSLLLPAAWLYGGVVALRNAAFDNGLFTAKDVGIPVISVGNISAGGTGKTPLVESLARMLVKRGYTTGVLSRGYGRETAGFRWVRNRSFLDTDALQCGDEPVQIAQNIPEALVAVDEDRVEGAGRMIAEAGIQILLLDDGFQHRWLGRSCDIVVMTASEVLGRDRLIPAGRWREPIGSLSRAQMVVVTGCTGDEICAAVRTRLRSVTDIDMFYTYPIISGLIDMRTGRRTGAAHLAGKRVLAVSGIGNPGSFRETLERSGVRVSAHQAFADHHRLTATEVSDLGLVSRQEACEAIVMTQKDAVRMKGDTEIGSLDDIPVYHTMMRMEWIGGEGGFERAALNAVRRSTAGM